MKYYYLINGKIMSATKRLPLSLNHNISEFSEDAYNNWLNSLRLCEISESELDKIKLNVGLESYNTPIEVTDIVEEKDIPTRIIDNIQVYRKTIVFKQPKQVEEIEAVEFAEWLNNNCATDGDNAWRYYQKGGSLFTTKQLYEIFKNQK